MSDNQNWRWTSKGPTLVFGLLSVLLGLLLLGKRWRYALPIAFVLLAGGFLTIVYSTTVHGWCAPTGAAAFGAQWGSGFWHGPSAWDCWHLVNPLGPKGR